MYLTADSPDEITELDPKDVRPAALPCGRLDSVCSRSLALSYGSLYRAAFRTKMRPPQPRKPGYVGDRRCTSSAAWLTATGTKTYAMSVHKSRCSSTAARTCIVQPADGMRSFTVRDLDASWIWGASRCRASDAVQGIRTARLPIGGLVQLTSSTVLTVNQVVEILLEYLGKRDWAAAFHKVIPQRKRAAGADGTEGNTKRLKS